MTYSFVAIDFETANNSRASVCSIGMAKYQDGELVARYSQLVKPHPTLSEFLNDQWHIGLHGIDASMVANAPDFGEIWPETAAFIDGLPMVAHSALNVEMNSLYRLHQLYGVTDFEADFICSLDLAKAFLSKTNPLRGYGLKFVARELGMPDFRHHDALADAETAGEVIVRLVARANSSTLFELLEITGYRPMKFSSSEVASKIINRTISRGATTKTAKATLAEFGVNESAAGPLRGAVLLISGTLMGMQKSDAWKMACEAGATPVDKYRSDVTHLLLGANEFAQYHPEGRFTEKMREVFDSNLAGGNIEVISQAEYLELLGVG